MGMSRRTKIWLLIVLTLAAVVAVMSQGIIRQEQAYHRFCDQRVVWGIPNFANVVSNLGFWLVGVAGAFSVWRSAAAKRLKLIYYVVFYGIFLTGLGSGIYHYHPDDGSLVLDRLPMTIVFMGMVAATMEEGVGPRVGSAVLWPLVGAGFFSVWWWRYTGDLRFYILAQYYPILLITAALLLFKNAQISRGWPPLLLCFGLYALAKVVETLDCGIFSALRWVSGHTLKHLLAALATGCLAVRFRIMYTRDR